MTSKAEGKRLKSTPGNALHALQPFNRTTEELSMRALCGGLSTRHSASRGEHKNAGQRQGAQLASQVPNVR
jgi:hypothetical protein